MMDRGEVHGTVIGGALSRLKATSDMLTVGEMAADLRICDDKVRQWCRSGAIAGAVNVGQGKREVWRAPRQAWEAFKESRRARCEPVLGSAKKRLRHYEPRYARA